jgi:hypothetical protein
MKYLSAVYNIVIKGTDRHIGLFIFPYLFIETSSLYVAQTDLELAM